MNKICPWPKDSQCEALCTCKECLEHYYSKSALYRLLDRIFHMYAKSWQRVQW